MRYLLTLALALGTPVVASDLIINGEDLGLGYQNSSEMQSAIGYPVPLSSEVMPVKTEQSPLLPLTPRRCCDLNSLEIAAISAASIGAAALVVIVTLVLTV